MKAKEAKLLTEAHRDLAIGRQYGLMKRMIEWKAGLGQYNAPLPDGVWPEVISQLEGEGYRQIGGRIYWGVNEPK